MSISFKQLSRRDFLKLGVATTSLVEIVGNFNAFSDGKKSVADIPNYNMKQFEWNPENVTDKVCSVFDKEGLFDSLDLIDFINVSRNGNWRIDESFDKGGETIYLKEALPEVGSALFIDNKNRQVYTLTKEDKKLIGNFPELRLAGIGDNGLCAYLSAVQSEDDWEWNVRALVFADFNKKRKTIICPNEGKKWETAFFTGDDFMSGFNMSSNGNVAVVYSGSLENSHMYLIDTDKFEVVHEQNNALFSGMNSDGRVIVIEKENGYYRNDLKSGEKTFLYRGNDYFNLSPDGNFLVGTQNPLIGISDSEGNYLDTSGIRIYSHSDKKFFNILNFSDEYFKIDVNDRGTVSLGGEKKSLELRYENGMYKFYSCSGNNLADFENAVIKQVPEITFKPYPKD
ncbi:MAG TPA: hypothetical protein P5277_00690 [Candidatus Paceibacterota bacterium]|nr:hypothetical protein [Candidatus Paceibacterota bacterium]